MDRQAKRMMEPPFFPPLNPAGVAPAVPCKRALECLLLKSSLTGNSAQDSEDLMEQIEAKVSSVALKNTAAQRGQTDDEVLAIVAFTADFNLVGGDNQRNLYLRLNKILGERNDKAFPEVADWYRYLMSGLRKIKPVEITTHRGIANVQLADAYKVGCIKCWTRFTSTTTKREVSDRFLDGAASTLLKIHCKNARPIREYSLLNDEEEYVLLPNTYVEVRQSINVEGLRLLECETGHADIGARLRHANVIEVHELSTDQVCLESPLVTEMITQLHNLNKEKFKFMPFFVEGIVHESEAVFMDRFTQISARFQGQGNVFDDVAVAWKHFRTMSAKEANGNGVNELLVTRPHFRMLLEAPAGSGKTTLVKWISRETKRLVNRSGQPLQCVVVVELLRLEEYFLSATTTTTTTTAGQSTAIDDLVEHVFSMPEMMDYAGKRWFEHKTAKECADILTHPLVMDHVLYILDGFDELPRVMSAQMKALLIALQTEDMQQLPFMRHVIVTSRPERVQSLGPTMLFAEDRFVKMRLEPWSERACSSFPSDRCRARNSRRGESVV